MNYVILVIGGVLSIASIYWFVPARHWFIDPKRTDRNIIPLPSEHVTTENKTTIESLSDIIRTRF